MDEVFLEVAPTILAFFLFLVVIPVGVFTADIVKNYYKKQKSRRKTK